MNIISKLMRKFDWKITISEPIDEEIRLEMTIRNKTKEEALEIVKQVCKEKGLIIAEIRRTR